MFLDEVTLKLSAGRGGAGAVSFRTAKFVPKGGPDGGNGGKGGNVYIEAVNNLHTLSDFRHQKEFAADNGQDGSQNNRTGKTGEHLLVQVPVGTQISDENGLIIDMNRDGQRFLLCEGGIGGKGNAGFVSSIRQAPKFAELGDIGDEKVVKLEMKLVADVAIVGLPSVGKSTFIATVTNARPKVAAYHFTTLVPNLGVCTHKSRDIIFVDVPGLIKNAHTGKGLGITFLKHIERARIVLHLVSAESETPLKDYDIIKNELKSFSPALAEKKTIIVLSKTDTVDTEMKDFLIKELEKRGKEEKNEEKTLFALSSATKKGLEPLLNKLLEIIPQGMEYKDALPSWDSEKDPKLATGTVHFRPEEHFEDYKAKTEILEDLVIITHPRLEQIARMTPPHSEEAEERIYDVLKKWGIIARLYHKKVPAGTIMKIGEKEILFRG